MASEINFVDFVLEQIKNSGEITAKKIARKRDQKNLFLYGAAK